MEKLADQIQNLLSQGSVFGTLFALGLAYVGGILSSLTPCIYPMIPITIGVVGGMPNRKSADTKRKIIARGVAYVLGMALVYAFLGVLAGVTGQVFGTLTNTSGWYLGLGIVMTLAALVMMDVLPFDTQVLLEKTKRLIGLSTKNHQNDETEATLVGAFTLGASSGFIAAPCTTPVLTAILAFIAQTQSVVLGLGLMLFFAFGLGTLLILIAAFAGSLSVLPKSGNWMNKIKIFSGVLILAFAEYLFFKAGSI